MNTPLSALLGLGLGSAKEWTVGMAVKRRQLVVSPLDDELYRRKTATGAGATDPANDLTNYNAVSYQRTTAITNAWSAGGAPFNTGPLTTGNLLLAAPVISAGVRTQLLSVTGKGVLNAAVWLEGPSNSIHSVRLELIVDGRAIFDATNSYVAFNRLGVCMTGAFYKDSATESYLVTPQPVEFVRSLAIYATSSAGVASGGGYLGTDLKLRG